MSVNTTKVHRRTRSSRTNDLKEYLDKYTEKMAEIFKPTQQIYEPMRVEAIKFDIDRTQDSDRVSSNILDLISGETIEVVVTALNIVEQYVQQQSRGQLFTYEAPKPVKS